MPKLSADFGFHPGPLEIEVGDIVIKPLPDQPENVKKLKSNPQVENHWFYAPLQPSRDLCTGTVSEKPYTARIFGLPKTHTITHGNAESQDHLKFLVWVLGFFTGLRLTIEEAGFIDATPVRPFTLVDFVAMSAELRQGIELAEQFWKNNHLRRIQTKRYEAAIHALFLAQNPLYMEYERFFHLYIALDACYALLQCAFKWRNRIPHGNRVAQMCKHFDGMCVPDWAKLDGSTIADLRNAIVHEGLSANEPLGFKIDDFKTHGTLTLQMQALICRLLVAIIGGKSSNYVRTPVNTREKYGLDWANK